LADIGTDPVHPAFISELRRVLHHLYDPIALRHSAFIQLFDLEGREDAPLALREIMAGGIEALKPEPGVPPRTRAWRIYELLYSRYVEQFTQREVAEELALSIRHLRREETAALESLGNYFWQRYDLATRWTAAEGTPEPEAPLAEMRTPTEEQELEWAQESLSSQVADIKALIRGVLELCAAFAQEAEIDVHWEDTPSLPDVLVPPTAVRQALLTIMTLIMRRVPTRRVLIQFEVQGAWVYVSILCQQLASSLDLDQEYRENLDIARQLIELSGGSLQLGDTQQREGAICFRVALPAQEPTTVLVVDDNVDTLRLLQRYLSNTRYGFCGTSDPDQAVQMAIEHSPEIVVLDVMLPQIDGWELLGRLRQHPETADIPVIVCTILPHEQLALKLGAEGFVRKPLNRQAFLEALDRQLAAPSPGSL
jgi:CheY-like chemotaxis protein